MTNKTIEEIEKQAIFICDLTGYSDEELKEAIKLMLSSIMEAWQDSQIKN